MCTCLHSALTKRCFVRYLFVGFVGQCIVNNPPIVSTVLQYDRLRCNVKYVSPFTLLCVHLGTVYPKIYAHGFVVLCFVVVMQSFIMNSLEVFIHIHQGCFAGTGAIVRLPQCQRSKHGGYGKISQCITTTKHSKAKTVCIFLGIYCICVSQWTGSSLIQVMACRLFDAKPSPEPMLVQCQLDSWE